MKLNSLLKKILFSYALTFFLLLIIMIVWHQINNKEVAGKINLLVDHYSNEITNDLMEKQAIEYQKFMKNINRIIAVSISSDLSDVFCLEKILKGIINDSEAKISTRLIGEKPYRIEQLPRLDNTLYSSFTGNNISNILRKIYNFSFINEILFIKKNEYYKLEEILNNNNAESLKRKLKNNNRFLSYFLDKKNNVLLVKNLELEDKKKLGAFFIARINFNKSLEQYKNLLAESNIDYLIITDNNQKIIYSCQRKGINRSLNSLMKQGTFFRYTKKINSKKDEGIYFFKYKKGKYYAETEKIENISWKVTLITSERSMFAGINDIEHKFLKIKEACIATYIALHNKNVYFIFYTFILCFILICVLFIFLIRKALKPLNNLKEAVEQVGKGKLRQKVPILSTGDEIESLSRTFNNMTDDLNNYIKNLSFTIREKQKIEADLKAAADIQTSILPTKLKFPADDQERFVEVLSRCIPSKIVSGDFFDYFFIENKNLFNDNDHLFFVIGDVSGKGMPASLFMMTIKTILKNYIFETVRHYSLNEIMLRVNNAVARDNRLFMFATMFCGVINVKTGETNCVCAGHENPLLYRKALDEIEIIKTSESTVLGTPLKNTFFSEISFNMNKGDILFLYTDGLTDIMNENNAYYGQRRLISTLSKSMEGDTDDIVSCIEHEIQNFSNRKVYEDDITYLLIKRKD